MTGAVGTATGTAWEVRALGHLRDLMHRVSRQDDLASVLDMVAEAAVDVVGFRVAAVSVVDASGDLVGVAVAGDPDARRELLGHVTPRAALDTYLAARETQGWGSLCFVPAERIGETAQDGWVSTEWRSHHDDEDAWDREDTLFGPFFDATGDLLGILSVDLPLDGRRPGATQRAVLELFANQTGIAVEATRQRRALGERVRLGEAVRAVGRLARDDLVPARIAEVAAPRIGEALGADALWLHLAGGSDGDCTGAWSRCGRPVDGSAVQALATGLGPRLWRAGTHAVARPGGVEPATLWRGRDGRLARDMLSAIGAGSLLVVPVGSGGDCLGAVVAVRGTGRQAWTDDETGAALEMGRDLGRAVRTARLLSAERDMAADLRRADRARTQLFSTVSHELKNPLASIVGHLELLREDPGAAEWSLAVMARNTERLQVLVDDLLTLSRVSDPDREVPFEDVDVARLTRDVVDMFRPRADGAGVSLSFAEPGPLPLVHGHAGDLERVVQNLVSNGVKFTPPGGSVAVSVERRGGEVRLTCADSGIGISADDQQHLFTEFFRGTNPAGLQVPGTGLGLSIAHRVVARHGGSLQVISELGHGTSVTLLLPAG